MKCKSKKVKYKKGYKYVLIEQFVCSIPIYPEEDIITDFIKLSKNGKLIIEKYYAWDGASGPTIDTKSSIRGSLVHDALYQLMRMELLDISWRPVADYILKSLCKTDGMCWVRRNIWERCVNWFASGCASKDNVKKVLIAP